jgi:RND superfamily putative drug exporter
LMLVPALMKLLGDANWWLPPWLDRLLPSMDSAVLPGPAPDHSQTTPSLSPSVYQSYSGSVPR